MKQPAPCAIITGIDLTMDRETADEVTARLYKFTGWMMLLQAVPLSAQLCCLRDVVRDHCTCASRIACSQLKTNIELGKDLKLLMT